MRSCSFVKFQALVVMLEHCKCDELTRALCRLLLKFDVFDHFFTEKVAGIFWGGSPLPAPPLWRTSSPNPPPPALLS